MANQKKPPEEKEVALQSYLAIAVVFFVVGVAMIASESTRVPGIVFFVLGLTFFALGQKKTEK